MSYAVYIASAIENAPQVQALEAEFRDRGIGITYSWSSHGELTDEAALRRAMLGEVKGVQRADVFVLMLPGKLGSGIEFGLAYSAHIPIIVLREQVAQTKPFFFLPGVTTVYSKSELFRTIDNMLTNKELIA